MVSGLELTLSCARRLAGFEKDLLQMLQTGRGRRAFVLRGPVTELSELRLEIAFEPRDALIGLFLPQCIILI